MDIYEEKIMNKREGPNDLLHGSTSCLRFTQQKSLCDNKSEDLKHLTNILRIISGINTLLDS